MKNLSSLSDDTRLRVRVPKALYESIKKQLDKKKLFEAKEKKKVSENKKKKK
jgi:hypothetical protein